MLNPQPLPPGTGGGDSKSLKGVKNFSAHDKSQVSRKLRRKSPKTSAFLKNSKGGFLKDSNYLKYSKTNDNNAFIKGETRFDKSNGFIKSEAGPGNDKGVPSAHQ